MNTESKEFLKAVRSCYRSIKVGTFSFKSENVPVKVDM